MSATPIRVAFTMISRERWAGGYNYLYNLFSALHRHRPHQIAPVIFAADNGNSDLDELGRIPGVEVVRSGSFGRARAALLEALLTGLDRRALHEFRTRDIDVVFETARFFGWRLPVPTIAWFPDFQHRRLPHLFSQAARLQRELGFRAQMASGRLVMLSSESARRDCEKFYPSIAAQASVVRFASQPSADLLTARSSDVAAHYLLSPGYFYLPNQFWRHKNHGIVLDALEILAQRGVDAVIVASGSNVDHREPDYFGSIMRQIDSRALGKNLRYLGMIPLPHVYALLRLARALINPSRFEGWSTTIEEAKSFGVPMILSDLEVHREQAGSGALYFSADDAEALADHLAAAAGTAPPAAERDLLPEANRRAAGFASEFVLTVQRAMHRA